MFSADVGLSRLLSWCKTFRYFRFEWSGVDVDQSLMVRRSGPDMPLSSELYPLPNDVLVESDGQIRHVDLASLHVYH